MTASVQANSDATVWQTSPTTADLIKATNKMTVHLSGLPSGMAPYDVAQRLSEMKLPLIPLPVGTSLVTGEGTKDVKLSDGQILCTAQSDAGGFTDLKFTKVLADLLQPAPSQGPAFTPEMKTFFLTLDRIINEAIDSGKGCMVGTCWKQAASELPEGDVRSALEDSYNRMCHGESDSFYQMLKKHHSHLFPVDVLEELKQGEDLGDLEISMRAIAEKR